MKCCLCRHGLLLDRRLLGRPLCHRCGSLLGYCLLRHCPLLRYCLCRYRFLLDYCLLRYCPLLRRCLCRCRFLLDYRRLRHCNLLGCRLNS